MSDSRKIVINESFLSSSSASKKSRKGGKVKTRKEKPKSVIKPNSLKKTLLEKIKKHQQHEKMTKDESSRDKSSRNESDDSTKKENQFHDNFMNSLEYLNKLNEKNKMSKKNRTKRNKSMKNGAVVGGSNHKPVSLIQNPVEPLVLVDLPMDFDSRHTVPQPYVNNNGNFGETIIHTSTMSENPIYGGANIPPPYPTTPVQMQPMQPIPPVESVQPMQPIHQVQPRPITPDTPYGCLKGGKKPTYRAYHNKTLKNKPLTIETSNTHNNNAVIVNTERKQKLAELKKSYKKIRQKKRTTRKSTFTLGKVGGKVSVLIKNNATRRKVKREHGLLKQKSIIEIKKHLYDKNLLKIGSTAPNDVLRTLYEQSILAGDVTNTANDVQIHNFMNK